MARGWMISLVVPALLGWLSPVHPAQGANLSPPGVVIAYSAASTQSYLGSPSLVALADGTLVASHDLFGPGTTRDTVRVYGSVDRGIRWTRRAEIRGAFWSSLFVHRGALYLFGTGKQDGDMVIRRSVDNGWSWTQPLDGSSGHLRADARYHCAPVPVIEFDGRLWRAFEDIMGPGGWGSNFRAMMMSISVDADLLVATNWVESNRLGRDPTWLEGRFGGWLEGNAVETPDHRLVNVLRADFRDSDEKAAIIEISRDGRAATFDANRGFVRFPGGCKKFTIRKDPRGGGYWALSNAIPPSQRGGNVERTRNTLALLYSPDLRLWNVRAQLLQHPDRDHHAFQYPDWQFDGDDLIAAVRTAFDDEFGGAHNCHDANFITFHRWEHFRDLPNDEPTAKR